MGNLTIQGIKGHLYVPRITNLGQAGNKDASLTASGSDLKHKGNDGEVSSSSTSEQVELNRDQAVIAQLKRRDREVRQHEQAHKAAGGPYVIGGAKFTYETGPDGRQYAISGEVDIDVSPDSSPEKTIRKMEVVKRAALAPAHPSAQDRKVASRAQALEQQAMAELVQERGDKGGSTSSDRGYGQGATTTGSSIDLWA